MATNAQVYGPDFIKGVSVDLIKDGETLLGHVGDKAVMLVSLEGEIYAVGAKCSHYGGPLSEGIIVGSKVHCPWHHGSFNVKTGRIKPKILSWSLSDTYDVPLRRRRTILSPALNGVEALPLLL